MSWVHFIVHTSKDLDSLQVGLCGFYMLLGIQTEASEKR